MSGGAVTVTGTVAIDKGDTWVGAGFYVTDRTSKQIFPGTINLSMGNPTPGGAAVPYTGLYSILPTGNYQYTVTMSSSAGGVTTKLKSSGGFTVP